MMAFPFISVFDVRLTAKFSENPICWFVSFLTLWFERNRKADVLVHRKSVWMLFLCCSRRALAKLVQVFDHITQRNEKIANLIASCPTSDETNEGLSSFTFCFHFWSVPSLCSLDFLFIFSLSKLPMFHSSPGFWCRKIVSFIFMVHFLYLCFHSFKVFYHGVEEKRRFGCSSLYSWRSLYQIYTLISELLLVVDFAVATSIVEHWRSSGGPIENHWLRPFLGTSHSLKYLWHKNRFTFECICLSHPTCTLI